MSVLTNKGNVSVPWSDGPRKRLKRMRLIVLGAAKMIEWFMQKHGHRYRVGFVTLTYRNDFAWEPNHIQTLIRHYRQWAKRRGITFRCVWVAELTKRGRVHYHIAFWLPRGITPPLPDKQGWWKHGSTNAQWARRPVAYLVKYASKGLYTPNYDFPKHCRICGISGSPVELGWFRAPKWLRQFSIPGDKVVRKGEWWQNRSTGFEFRSPWLLDGCGPNGISLRWVGHTQADVRIIENDSDRCGSNRRDHPDPERW